MTSNPKTRFLNMSAATPGSVQRDLHDSGPAGNPPPLTAVEELVVAWDGTPPAARALDWAVRRLAASALRLTIVAVIDSSAGGADYIASDADQMALDSRLDRAAQEAMKAAPKREIETMVLRGDPVQTLLSFTGPHTLVVVGTHARAKPYYTFEWSIGALLAGTASGPIAIIPEDLIFDPKDDVVVAVDGGPVSSEAALFAAKEAHTLGQALTVLHAWQPQREMTGSNISDRRREETLHQAIIDRISDDVQGRYPGLAVKRLLIEGPAGHEVEAAARTAGLVVVGNHNSPQSLGQRAGSVTRHTIAHLTSPTIVYIPAPTSQERM